jgi:hypothetical protein
MADHRKTFRPRHLVLGASLLLVGSILPALAEDAGLKNGAASLAAGKYDNAVRQLSSTINAENAVAAEAARALYLRGIAYRKLGQPARAISDLGSFSASLMRTASRPWSIAGSPIRPPVSRARAMPRSHKPAEWAGTGLSISSSLRGAGHPRARHRSPPPPTRKDPPRLRTRPVRPAPRGNGPQRRMQRREGQVRAAAIA